MGGSANAAKEKILVNAKEGNISNAKGGNIPVQPTQAMSDAQVGFEQKYDVALAGSLIVFSMQAIEVLQLCDTFSGEPTHDSASPT